MKVSDVPIDGFFGVVGFSGDFRSQISFEIEGNDFLFVSDSAAEIMDISPGWEYFAGFFLDFLDILRDDGIAAS